MNFYNFLTSIIFKPLTIFILILELRYLQHRKQKMQMIQDSCMKCMTRCEKSWQSTTIQSKEHVQYAWIIYVPHMNKRKIVISRRDSISWELTNAFTDFIYSAFTDIGSCHELAIKINLEGLWITTSLKRKHALFVESMQKIRKSNTFNISTLNIQSSKIMAMHTDH